MMQKISSIIQKHVVFIISKCVDLIFDVQFNIKIEANDGSDVMLDSAFDA